MLQQRLRPSMQQHLPADVAPAPALAVAPIVAISFKFIPTPSLYHRLDPVASQKRLFPNCTYSTVSTSWIICNNNWGKSIGRTRDIEAMNHHVNNLKEGAKRLTPSSALRMHHHTIRSLEDAQIKVSHI